MNQIELLTSSIALIKRLSSSSSSSSAVHGLAALLLPVAQANGILDTLHVRSVWFPVVLSRVIERSCRSNVVAVQRRRLESDKKQGAERSPSFRGSDVSVAKGKSD